RRHPFLLRRPPAPQVDAERRGDSPGVRPPDRPVARRLEHDDRRVPHHGRVGVPGLPRVRNHLGDGRHALSAGGDDRSARAEPRRLGKVPAHALLARPGLLLSGLALVSIVAAISARDVEFEFNGRALQSDSTYARTHEDTQLISRIFGQDIHAGILVRPSLEEARSALERARAARHTSVDQGSSVVAELFAVTDLLPPENIDPAARRVRIEALLEEDELARLEEIAGVESKLRRKKMLSDGASDDFDDVDDGEADPSGEG